MFNNKGFKDIGLYDYDLICIIISFVYLLRVFVIDFGPLISIHFCYL